MKKFLVSLVSAVISLTSLSMYGQTSYGTVAGSVTDTTGASIVGATVTIKSRETGETHVAMTSGSGGYQIQSVGTGHYDVTAEAPNFSKTVAQNITVTPSVTTSVNEVLKPGSTSDTVEVAASNEVLQTESGELSGNISGKEISELPISGLNPTTLATTMPGVTTITAGSSGNGPQFSVNGSRPRANNYLIEGQDDNDAALTGQGLQPGNTEAFDNVSFLLNGYGAEFGYAGGGITNIVYKSGTNNWHGSVYDRLLNSSLNAINHQNRLNGLFTKTKSRENIYGGTIGFPILHNRLFMFAAYQQDHFRSSSILSTLVVPTVNGYAVLNNFKSNPRIANLITAYGGLQGATPASNQYTSSSKNVALGPDPVTGVDRGTVEYGGVQRVIGRPSNSSELDLKSDWQATSADKVQFRFIRTYSLIPYDTGNFPSQLPLFDTNQGGPAENAGIVHTHVFTPNLVNELRLSYGRISFTFDLRPDTKANPLAVGPTVAIAGVQGYGIPTNVPQGRGHNTYQLQDALSWSHGNHTLRGGFDVNQIRVRDAVPFIFYGSFSYVASTGVGTTYTSLGNYMDDFSGYTTSTGQSMTQNFGSNIARPTLTNQNYYIQDHWKASPRLAVDFGLRYEYTGAPFNYLGSPATDPTQPFNSFSTPVKQNPVYNSFAPRFGFAYQPFDDGKTVVRGAFGLFYDHSFTNVDDNIQASAPNAASPVLYGSNAASARGTAAWSTQFSTLSHTPLPGNSQTTVTNNLSSPLTYQYNLNVERSFPGGWAMTIGYAGSRALHLYSLDTLNPVIGSTGLRVNTSRSLITLFDSVGSSDYNSLQLELEHKFRHSLQFRGAFTYAKGLDNVSDPYTTGNISAYPQIQPAEPGAPANARGLEWGPSAYDHRLRGVGTLVYQTPSFHWSGGKSILAHIVNNYTVSGIPNYQSGTVYNLLNNYDINNDGINNDRPILENPNAPINTFAVDSTRFYTAAQGAGPGVFCDGSYINNANKQADAVCHPVQLSQMHFYLGTFGQQARNTVSRDTGYTPGLWNVDAALQREFKMFERHSIAFRAESFNILNHANTGVPSFTLYGTTLLPIAATYGRGTFANYASTQTGARTLRFFMRYSF
ncbi:MAG TPA: carboxypeptidase regulatory-like domain-containing protein [Acidobacteriaceae bacterium]|jgi:hypothetical protein